MKPNWADLTDAELGVGVSNYEVKFRDAELARLHRSDYSVRVHRSRSRGDADKMKQKGLTWPSVTVLLTEAQ